MSELDVAKEQIAYLKFWLGIMVVIDISLSGWLISNANSTSLRLPIGGCLAVIAITVGIVPSSLSTDGGGKWQRAI